MGELVRFPTPKESSPPSLLTFIEAADSELILTPIRGNGYVPTRNGVPLETFLKALCAQTTDVGTTYLDGTTLPDNPISFNFSLIGSAKHTVLGIVTDGRVTGTQKPYSEEAFEMKLHG